jgi:hypothetical protein
MDVKARRAGMVFLSCWSMGVPVREGRRKHQPRTDTAPIAQTKRTLCQSDRYLLHSQLEMEIVLGSGGSHKLGTLLVGDEYTVRSKTNMNVHGFRAVRVKVMILCEFAIGVEFAQPMCMPAQDHHRYTASPSQTDPPHSL